MLTYLLTDLLILHFYLSVFALVTSVWRCFIASGWHVVS